MSRYRIQWFSTPLETAYLYQEYRDFGSEQQAKEYACDRYPLLYPEIQKVK